MPNPRPRSLSGHTDRERVSAKTVDVDDIGKVELTEQQILNTFMHELMHVWQFYFNNHYDEAQAQVFANFMCEYIKTKENQLPF